MAFSFPRRRLAALTATRPSTWSAASMTHHCGWTSEDLAENVPIKRGAKPMEGVWKCQTLFREKCEEEAEEGPRKTQKARKGGRGFGQRIERMGTNGKRRGRRF